MKWNKIVSILLVMMLLVSGCGAGTESGKDNDRDTQKETQNSQETEKEESESEDTEEETESEEVIDVTGMEEKTLYAQTKVNVRKAASTSSEKLGALAKNDEVKAYGDAKDGWQIIAYEEGYAYVSAEYLGTEKVKSPIDETIKEVDEITAEDFPYPDVDPSKKLIVIDAGHQGKTNKEKEPNGPGSSTMKTKVATGTKGVSTGIMEYLVNLQVSLKLQAELEARGYQVVMIRTTNNINISNAQRAIVANNLNADAFIRIHCNGSDDSSVKGAMTICQTSGNPYNGDIYSTCRKLSDYVVDSICDATGAKNRSVWETDTMTGINWCTVPTTIVEMGFMTNPSEDELLCTDSYQDKMVQGISNGIDAYLGR